jgi:diguanylate cyclase (GGDEF)-like protein
MDERSNATLVNESAAGESAAMVDGQDALQARNGELASQLRAAALKGDKLRVTRLLSHLLGFRGLSVERRTALEELTGLIDSLRSLAMTDELTGIYNRRGFLQIANRFLDVARRDLQCAYLVYIDLNNLKQVNDSAGHATGDVLIRQTGSFLRELFPSYGVYEILGRLGGDEFAALTTDMKCPSRSEILLRARMFQAGSSPVPPLSLSVGLAYFNPLLPLGINELLHNAERAMYEHKRLSRGEPRQLGAHPAPGGHGSRSRTRAVPVASESRERRGLH